MLLFTVVLPAKNQNSLLQYESQLSVDPCELEWPDVLEQNSMNQENMVGICSETSYPDPDSCLINPLSDFFRDAPTSVPMACNDQSNSRYTLEE